MKIVFFLYKKGAGIGRVHSHQLALKFVEKAVSIRYVDLISTFPKKLAQKAYSFTSHLFKKKLSMLP
jgi:hypothetical protein